MGDDNGADQAGSRAEGSPPSPARSIASLPPATGGKGWSRRSKAPRSKLPNGAVEARRLLTEAEVLDGLRLDDEALAALRACCSLRPPRNAASIVAAIKARLEYSQPKPRQEIQHSGGIEITRVERVIVDGDPKP